MNQVVVKPTCIPPLRVRDEIVIPESGRKIKVRSPLRSSVCGERIKARAAAPREISITVLTSGAMTRAQGGGPAGAARIELTVDSPSIRARKIDLFLVGRVAGNTGKDINPDGSADIAVGGGLAGKIGKSAQAEFRFLINANLHGKGADASGVFQGDLTIKGGKVDFVFEPSAQVAGKRIDLTGIIATIIPAGRASIVTGVGGIFGVNYSGIVNGAAALVFGVTGKVKVPQKPQTVP